MTNEQKQGIREARALCLMIAENGCDSGRDESCEMYEQPTNEWCDACIAQEAYRQLDAILSALAAPAPPAREEVMNSKSELRRMALQQPLDVAEKLAAAQNALAAADRLAEAINVFLWNKQGIGSCDDGAFAYYVAKGELIVRLSDEVATYLAERGR